MRSDLDVIVSIRALPARPTLHAPSVVTAACVPAYLSLTQAALKCGFCAHALAPCLLHLRGRAGGELGVARRSPAVDLLCTAWDPG